MLPLHDAYGCLAYSRIHPHNNRCTVPILKFRHSLKYTHIKSQYLLALFALSVITAYVSFEASQTGGLILLRHPIVPLSLRGFAIGKWERRGIEGSV